MADKTADSTIRDALDLFRESQDATQFSRDAYDEDTRFARLGDQWPEDAKQYPRDDAKNTLEVAKAQANQIGFRYQGAACGSTPASEAR